MAATNPISVDPTNADQLRAWDGDEGAYWAEHAEYYDRSIAAHHERLLAAAAIAPDSRVLDLGCGTGQTTRDAARAASRGFALGVDLSSQMLDYARGRASAEGLTNVAFEQADAQTHPFEPAAFDIAIGRTVAMFFGDKEAAFANVGRALVPGGRLVLTTWQAMPDNEWLREISGALSGGRARPAPPPDAPGPFALSDPDRVRAVLSAAGYTDVDLDGNAASMWFGHDADDAHRFLLGQLGWMLEGLDAAERAGAIDALRATLAAHETSDGVTFGSGAWTITATRT